MAVSTQKIVAVLRKAGLDIATYSRSQMVRGWTSLSTSGYRVRKYEDGIRISFETERALNFERTMARLVEAQKAIGAAGFASFVYKNGGLMLHVAENISFKVNDITMDDERVVEVKANGDVLVSSLLEAEEVEAAITNGARRVYA